MITNILIRLRIAVQSMGSMCALKRREIWIAALLT